MRRLIEIQQGLKAPKNQKNNFGGYNYRSCEDILEAVKPLLKKQGLALIIEDEVIAIDGGYTITEKDKKIETSNRVYIKATATLYDDEGKIIAKSSAIAREEETKRGMDSSQITGSTSSYARKYALNGLFAIDDTKDSDATNTHYEISKKKQELVINPDLDLIEGLKACNSYTELSAYYKKNYPAVKNKEAFNTIASELKAKYKEPENDEENNN